MKDLDVGFYVTVLIVTILGAIVAITALTNRHVEKMAELGYEEATIQGYSMTVWRKAGGAD